MSYARVRVVRMCVSSGSCRATRERQRGTYAVTRELPVDAHERKREGPPARVRRVEERGVVPDGLHLPHLDHLLELLQLELDKRVRLPVARMVLDHDLARLLVTTA